MDYKTAIRQTVEARKKKEADAKVLYLELLKTIPALYEAEKELRNAKMDAIKGKTCDAERINSLTIKRDEILKANGVTYETLNPPYSCLKCKDTGLIGGKPCSCVITKCATDATTDAGATFDKSDFSVFPTDEQERIAAVYGNAKAFCQKFPLTNKLNLLLIGRCGSGKSYLASCIANEISAKGYGVITLSAFAFSNRMLKYHTTFDTERFSFLDPLLDCDLLVIDDLGSETVLKNVTVEYLFHVVNERMSLNKHTIFTTNLDDEMIRSRYGERVYSRLFSKKSAGFILSNSDLRK